MNTDPLEVRRWILLHGIRRSIRYHDRRVLHYDMLHSCGRTLSLLFGAAAFASCATNLFPHATPIFALCVAFVSALELGFGFSIKARKHDDLKKRFAVLECRAEKIGEENITEDILRDIKVERLAIEADEPPVLHVLNIICHNEISHAEGRDDDLYTLPIWQRLLSGFVDIGEPRHKAHQAPAT